MGDSSVTNVNFGKGLNPKVMLHELADDEEIEGIAMVVRWKDGTLSTGSTGMKCSDMALGALMMQERALNESAVD